jgi:uncharacterized membrane protein (UPF0127 family)
MSLSRSRHIIGALAVVALAASGCRSETPAADQYAGLMHFDTATVRLIGRDTARLVVELAESDAQKTMGLMERHHLPANAGMLFLYSAVQPDSAAFWMYRTRIPLDIGFIDSTGVIRSAFTMQPCPTMLAQGCPAYPAHARFLAALEVNSGYFAAHQIGVGSRVVLGDTLTRHGASRTSMH